MFKIFTGNKNRFPDEIIDAMNLKITLDFDVKRGPFTNKAAADRAFARAVAYYIAKRIGLPIQRKMEEVSRPESPYISRKKADIRKQEDKQFAKLIDRYIKNHPEAPLIWLIFDGDPQPKVNYPLPDNVIYYSRSISADDMIVDILKNAPKKHKCSIITRDKRLKQRISSMGNKFYAVDVNDFAKQEIVKKSPLIDHYRLNNFVSDKSEEIKDQILEIDTDRIPIEDSIISSVKNTENTIKVAWATDIHLNFLDNQNARKYLKRWNEEDYDALLICGDIGQGNSIIQYLDYLKELIEKPVYFILGNHDYYYSSFEEVHSILDDWFARNKNTNLTLLGKLYDVNTGNQQIIKLTEETALIGHSGWADGRYGDYKNSEVIINDYLLIDDLVKLEEYTQQQGIGENLSDIFYSVFKSGKIESKRKIKRYYMLNKLGDLAADYLRKILPKALEKYPKVILITHIPPFVEACTYRGKPTESNFLPHFSCKATGDVIFEIMNNNPNKHLTVLCGHTHGGAEVVLGEHHNILAKTGKKTGLEPEI